MENRGISVGVILRYTGKHLTHFHVSSLADVPLVGDKAVPFGKDETYMLPAEVVGREVYYVEEDGGVSQVYSVCLTVVFPFEKWLYLWQDIVEMYQGCSDVRKAYRKSDRFLLKNADTSSVEFLFHHHDAYDIGSFGVSLLHHYIVERRKEEHGEIIE